MVVYVGLEDVVEGGVVVVAKLNNIQFRQSFTDVRGSRSSGRRTSGGVRSTVSWAKIGHGMNCTIPGWREMVRSKSSGSVDGKGWGGWGKLDPHVATQIHGSNPTKLQHTNKSQKHWGFFCWGFSDLGRNQQNQARKQRVGSPKT